MNKVLFKTQAERQAWREEISRGDSFWIHVDTAKLNRRHRWCDEKPRGALWNQSVLQSNPGAASTKAECSPRNTLVPRGSLAGLNGQISILWPLNVVYFKNALNIMLKC